MRLVKAVGGVFRLTEKNYRRMLEEGTKGEGVDLNEFGRLVAEDVERVTNWGRLDFEYALKDLGKRSSSNNPHNKSLLKLASLVRKKALRGAESAGHCESVSRQLLPRLADNGLTANVVYGNANGQGHVWVELEDGTVIDPTADQFNQPNGEPMPKVYVGPRPEWYK
jgi:hypothetical protein